MVSDLGVRIRALRRQRGLDLQELAQRASLSRPFVGQIEAGTASPSMKSLQQLADALNVPLATLFGDAQVPIGSIPGRDGMQGSTDAPAAASNGGGAQSPSPARTGGPAGADARNGQPDFTRRVDVVRADRRKKLVWPDLNERTELITPDLRRLLQVTLVETDPGGVMPEAHMHEGETLLWVLEGTYEAWIDGELYLLNAGDSIAFPAWLPHAYRVTSERPGKGVWVNTPPNF